MPPQVRNSVWRPLLRRPPAVSVGDALQQRQAEVARCAVERELVAIVGTTSSTLHRRWASPWVVIIPWLTRAG